ncbi:hypothetical protein LP420_14825 [Massilia sp. B-10]|nr:hypothetical protein LP420_14825 [Massilia sp. B-10]
MCAALDDIEFIVRQFIVILERGDGGMQRIAPVIGLPQGAGDGMDRHRHGIAQAVRVHIPRDDVCLSLPAHHVFAQQRHTVLAFAFGTQRPLRPAPRRWRLRSGRWKNRH